MNYIQQQTLIHHAMIKLIFTSIFFFFISQLSVSQNLNQIENSNTIFIKYDTNEKNTEKKTITEGKLIENNYCTYSYYFIAANGEVDKLYPIQFLFLGSLGSFKDKFLYYRLHKSFVRKNKELIITKEFMAEIGREKTRLLLKKAKAIFLIDTSEIENCQILVKQVAFHDIINQ